GIGYYNGKKVFISAEKTATTSMRVYELNTGNWTTAPATKIEAILSKEVVFTIHPNPVKGRSFRINISNLPQNGFELQVYDSTGRLYYRGDYELKPQGKSIEIKFIVKYFNPGLYVIKITSGQHYATRKVIIQ
ncbi:MAG: T9SS type A sorting domain-containing protein, partial [Bacteroidales bacterium]|nr:T9SS type A sorting domain-containing protein [Bacteroidales bacterium]